ncbi:MAG: LacI family DNA-binding transcriptional regulator [bacterium]|nr:LacI family DNA-binding transcriptional regulator [bacterium]
MAPNPPKLATIYDVADLAGVSHITVSRVVNGKQNVSPETRERVLKAMNELGYSPNPIAKTLQTRRSQVIELVTTDVWGSSAAMQSVISAVAQGFDFQLSILPTTVDALYNVLKAIPNRMVAGTLLYAQDVDLNYGTVQQIVQNYPLVQLGGRLQSGLPSVTYDQYQASTLAVQHLIDLGHREIGFIGGQQRLLDGRIRYEAYLDTLQRNHLKAGPSIFGDFGAPSGEVVMKELLARQQPFTALFISSDSMALSAIHVMRQAGLRVPEDVSVVGYDDDIFASFLSPPLTTMVNNAGLLARLAAEYLFELLQNPQTPRMQRILLPELILRQSTRPPQP